MSYADLAIIGETNDNDEPLVTISMGLNNRFLTWLDFNARLRLQGVTFLLGESGNLGGGVVRINGDTPRVHDGFRGALFIENSAFINNKSTGFGGTVYANCICAVYIENSRFIANEGLFGSAVRLILNGQSRDLVITDNLFQFNNSLNSSNFPGGALQILMWNSSNFVNSRATRMNNNQFIQNTFEDDAVGVVGLYLETIHRSITLNENTWEDNEGIALFLKSRETLTFNESSMTLNRSKISNNINPLSQDHFQVLLETETGADNGRKTISLVDTLVVSTDPSPNYGIRIENNNPAGTFILSNSTVSGHQIGLLNAASQNDEFIDNSIVYGNQLDTLEPNGNNFNNNISSIIGFPDPSFNDAANGDFTLADNSPAVDSGVAFEPPFPEVIEHKDVAGLPRFVGSSIDVGAHEKNQTSTLRVNVVGDGIVSLPPFSCGPNATCDVDFDSANEAGILIADGIQSSAFLEWQGGCYAISGNLCDLSYLTTARTVTATFIEDVIFRDSFD